MGGAAGGNSNAAGTTGLNYGGGGSGASRGASLGALNGATGANGAKGICIVTVFYQQV
jgi:hypothetical protein